MAEAWRTDTEVIGWKQNGTFPETYLDFIEDSLSKAFGTSLKNKKVLELGSRYSYKTDLEAKQMQHTCIEPCYEDADGNIGAPYATPAENSVLKIIHNSTDLVEYADTFDAIINIHVTEHIEPIEKQYTIWKNMHSMCKLNGVMIHILPDPDECFNYLKNLGHCHLYFGRAFFLNLATELGYEVLNNELLHWNRSVALKKVANVPFNLDEEVFTSTIAPL